jgi:hypothetical protein
MGERLVFNQLENAIDRIPGVEEVVVEGELNGCVGMDRTRYERWHWRTDSRTDE